MAIGVNSYINYQDVQNNGKPLDQAVANGIGGAVTGMAAAAYGAQIGVSSCAAAGFAGPVSYGACVAGVATLFGFGFGSLGAYAAEAPFK